MGSGPAVLVGLLLFVGGLVCAWLAFRQWSVLKLMQTKATRQIGSVAGGFVELKGRIVPLQTELSPYSGEPCVYYEFKVEEYRQNSSRGRGVGRNRSSGGSWHTINSGRRCFDFLIDDGTGRARISPEGAAFHLNVDAHARSGTFNDPTPQLQDFLNRTGVSSTKFFGMSNRTIRVSETILCPGDQMYVLGAARPDRNPASGAKVFVAKDPSAPAFIVSDKSEEELTSNFRRSAVGLSIFAALLIVVGPIVAATMGR